MLNYYGNRAGKFRFFFSSRRRHTRSLCDWSSDVYSSDLRSAMSSYQQEAAGGWYVSAKLGYKRIAVVALDYVAGHEQADGFVKTFMEGGGQSVEKVLMPLGAIDVAPYITRIHSKASELDAVDRKSTRLNSSHTVI